MALREFIDTEKKYNLLNKDINGFHFWTYLRAELEGSYVLAAGNLHGNYGNQKKSIASRIKTRMKQVKNIVLKGWIPKGACDLLVLNHPRKVPVDGIYECIYTEDIVRNIKNTVVLEEPYGNSHFQPTATKRLMYTDIVDFYGLLYCSFQKFFSPAD